MSTTGAIRGVVKEKTGEPMAGVTVVATSPALQGTQAEITDDTGSYQLPTLPPGVYLVTFYYNESKLERTGVEVGLNRTTTLNQEIDTGTVQAAETITITTRVGTVDTTSTKQSLVVGKDYLKNIPLPTRSFDGALTVVAGSSSDGAGISFAGSSSLENSYVIDGINTTGISVGNVASPILNNFIEEQEVITGGYDAEFGRSTGGVVNVVTKSGSNKFHGSVWTNFEPRQLRVESPAPQSTNLAINPETVPRYDLDLGFDLGGPVIKDKLWFYVGFAPILHRGTEIRKVGTRVDREINVNDYVGMPDGDADPTTNREVGCELSGTCESDGLPDLDPTTGLVKIEEISRTSTDQTSTQYNVLTKLNFAVNPDHQGAVSLWALPSAGDGSDVFGTPEAFARSTRSGSTDLSAKWTSKWRDNRSQLDAIVGYHNEYAHQRPRYASPYDPSTGLTCDPDDQTPAGRARCTATTPLSAFFFDGDGNWPSLGIAGRNPWHRESPTVLGFCTDQGAGDPSVADAFPSIENCPLEGTGYLWGGGGFFERHDERRLSGKVTWTERLRWEGHHEVKIGLDTEDNRQDVVHSYTGGQQNIGAYGWAITRLVAPPDELCAPGDAACAQRVAMAFPDTCGYDDVDNDGRLETPRPCKYLDQLETNSSTLNLSGFVQDKWQIVPHFTAKVGIRWEQQSIRYADEIQDTVDPYTGDQRGTNAIVLSNMIAPRVGLLYDFTKEGRSKVYANWGRFYESVPMDMNLRSFSAVTTYEQFYDYDDCGSTPIMSAEGIPIVPSRPEDCPRSPTDPIRTAPSQVRGGTAAVVPGLEPQYLDEFVLGFEYEVLEDIDLGISYQNRTLGQVIEDIGDGSGGFVIANPGELSKSGEAQLQDRIAAATAAGQTQLAGRLQDRLKAFERLKGFDTPRREYNAVVLTGRKRYADNFYVQGSYTWSRLEGNYGGLYAQDNGEVHPNISTQYDQIELVTNRDGLLPNDRTHVAKLDGYYQFDLKKAGMVTAGARFRIQSGNPVDVLGQRYGVGGPDTFILPRGSAGRTDFILSSDLHVGYGRDLGKDYRIEVALDLFNVFDQATALSFDEEYTFDATRAIVGGETEDLQHLKQVDVQSGKELGDTVRTNANFGNATSYFIPLRARLGATLSF